MTIYKDPQYTTITFGGREIAIAIGELTVGCWYRCGRSLGRTIYRHWPHDMDGSKGRLIGFMDTAEDAQLMVDTLNQHEKAQLTERWLWLMVSRNLAS